METPSKGHAAKPSPANLILAFALVGLGAVFCIAGIYVGDTDDAPGAALLGILLMVGTLALAVKIARRKPAPRREEG